MRFLFPPELMTAPSPFQWQGPSPLPQRHAGIRTGRGPKPPASARPAHGGRFSPAGSGAGLCPARTHRSTGHRRARAGETRCVSCSRPNSRRHPHRFNGRGHRPCHSVTLASGPAGGQSPRPAPAPATAGASRPPGRALASVPPGPTGLQGTVPRGRGKRDAFLVPARRGERPATDAMAKAIAFATVPRWHQDHPGAKVPGQRPPRPWRALLARRVGRWPLSLSDLPVTGAPFRREGQSLLPDRDECHARPCGRSAVSAPR